MVYANYWKARRYLQAPFDKYSNWRKQAELLKLSKQARCRLERLIYYETKAGENALKTCRHFSISPKVFYTWRNRFDGKNLLLLENKSKAPLNKRKRAITSDEEMRIVALRKRHIGWGKEKLARLYKTEYGAAVSSWKIQYTIRRYKLYYNLKKNEKLQQKRKRSQSKKRITELKKKPFPGFLIALDVVVLYINNTKRYVLTAIDTVSKIAFAYMYTSKSSRNAADFLRKVFYLLDGSFINALHDNGSEFHKEFQTACQDLKISQYWSRLHTPDDNPVNERFNRTLKEEFIALGHLTPDVLKFNHELTEWLIEYMFVRPHQALGYDTPWQFYQKAAKVLPMYSSRTGACE